MTQPTVSQQIGVILEQLGGNVERPQTAHISCEELNKNQLKNNKHALTLYGHIKTTGQRTVISQYSDWYIGRWWVGCYIWYSKEGPGRESGPTHQRPVYQIHIIWCGTIIASGL